MALTLTINAFWKAKSAAPSATDLTVASVRIAFDSSYVTGGEPVVVNDFPFPVTAIVGAVVAGTNVATKRPVWDADANKILIMVEDGTSGIEAQAASESDQSAVDDVQVLFILS